MSGRVLLSGYYGLGNAGDEAVLAASVGLFRQRDPSLSIAALSGDPAGTHAALSIEAAPRMHPPSVLAQIRRCDLFLSGGGSLLQDKTSLKSLFYYLWLLDTARLLRKRTMVFAQGIGPLIRPAARRWTGRVLSNVDAITVRDAASLELLRELGVGAGSRPSMEVTADPVFALEPRESETVWELTAGARPVIAVSLRPWPGVMELIERLAEALACFQGQATLQAWALHPHEDTPVCEELAARVPGMQVVRAPLSPAEWMALAERADVIVGMRLHALIFGAARGRPVLGLSYDPKVDALVDRVRAPLIGRLGEPLQIDRAARAIEAALHSPPAEMKDRQIRAVHLRELAAKNVDVALGLLRG